jgi:hypothetical protein
VAVEEIRATTLSHASRKGAFVEINNRINNNYSNKPKYGKAYLYLSYNSDGKRKTPTKLHTTTTQHPYYQ